MLKRTLKDLPGILDPDVLVGFETADDAGVYRIDENQAIVQTTDFFPPIVDDPFVYGQIAAANALSDIYAMGGLPKFALSIVGFPVGKLDEKMLRQIVFGGANMMREAEVSVIGGHSLKDTNIKFGYVVTGLAHPNRIYLNRGLCPGDALILTKPIGTGIITTAIKHGKCPDKVSQEATKWMLTLNRAAVACFESCEVHAVTDVTGYGLLGHAFEMAVASGVCLEIEAAKVPLMQGVKKLANDGLLPGGIESNKKYLGEAVEWGGTQACLQKILLDPQTSGGLLFGLPSKQVPQLLEVLGSAQVFAKCIGLVENRSTHYISIQ